jgi:hypothetical protein
MSMIYLCVPVARYNVVEYLGAYEIFSNEKRMKDCVIYTSCDAIIDHK